MLIFYSNIFGENYAALSFSSYVYKVPIHLNLDYISNVMGIPWELHNPIAFSPLPMTPNEKEDMIVWLYGKLMAWGTHLTKKPCCPLVKFLHRVFAYNLLPIIHLNELTFQMTYLTDAIPNDKSMEIKVIMCHMMIKATFVDHTMGSMPFPILLT